MAEVKERSKERPMARSEQPRGLKAGSMADSIRKVGVVGAGQMGNGIAHVCALSGLQVLLNDVVPERISEGLATINGNLARQVSPQRISEEQRQAAMKRMTPANSLDELGYFVFDDTATTEKEEV